ncbi:MAG: hypothetical protein WD749_11530 [Phycisphaerales bacterium]
MPGSTSNGRPPGEIAQRGAQIYEERLRPLLEPEHNGKFVVIDVDTGEYELDQDHLAASDRGRRQAPRRTALRDQDRRWDARARRGPMGRGPMIVGSVQPSGDAVVPVRVRGPRNKPAEFGAVVDTGFNGWLVLPRDAIQSLALPFLLGMAMLRGCHLAIDATDGGRVEIRPLNA